MIKLQTRVHKQIQKHACDLATQTQLITEGELMCSGSTYFTNGTDPVTHGMMLKIIASFQEHITLTTKTKDTYVVSFLHHGEK